MHFWGVFQFIQAQPLPSPHKGRWTRVSRIFFSEFQLCTGWGKKELQVNFERVHCFMREIKLCNEKLSLATTPVSERERSRERAFSRKRVAWARLCSGRKKQKTGPATFSPPRTTSQPALLADFLFRERRSFLLFPTMRSLVPG